MSHKMPEKNDAESPSNSYFRRASLLALVACVCYACSSGFSASKLIPSLKGQVAVVTGGSRGIGKGIAIGLAEVGATVYITGRTLSKGQNNTGGIRGVSQKGSLEETCEMVVNRGGRCVPVAVDSAADSQLEGLFERVLRDEGRLDILVNNAFSAVSWMPKHIGEPFWEKGIEAWDEVNKVGLRSHYVASVLASKHMSKLKRGLIVNVGSFGGSNYIFDVAYGIGKAAMDRMANDMAVELATENITMVSLWPGLVKTENVEGGALSGLKERRGLPPGMPEIDFNLMVPTPLAETPLFSGRAVATFARDPDMMSYTGKVLIPSVMAAGYGFQDERGVRSPPFTSVKGLMSMALAPVLKQMGLWEVPGVLFEQVKDVSFAARLYWSMLPDVIVPGKLMKLTSGAPNL